MRTFRIEFSDEKHSVIAIKTANKLHDEKHMSVDQ